RRPWSAALWRPLRQAAARQQPARPAPGPPAVRQAPQQEAPPRAVPRLETPRAVQQPAEQRPAPRPVLPSPPPVAPRAQFRDRVPVARSQPGRVALPLVRPLVVPLGLRLAAPRVAVARRPAQPVLARQLRALRVLLLLRQVVLRQVVQLATHRLALPP